MSDLVAYVDGGSLGNPGPSGIGVVIDGCESGPIRIAKWIGHQDNNVAEYAALLEALQCAVSLKAKALHVYSDSEVVVRQITSADGFPNRKQAQPAEVLAAATRLVHPWRTVLGEFNLTIPVSTKHQLLPGEEHLLSIMKWIAKDIPPGNRWYPVFQRYLEQVTLMGGDPRKVVPPGPAFGRSPRNQALGAGMNMVTNIT